MQRRTLLLAALPVGLALPAHARIAQLGDAIDKAGAQRMLSQRMGKAWLGLLQPELAPRARQVLDDSAARFERQLKELLAFAPTPQITGSYKALLHRFGDYRALLLTAPDREQVNELLKRSSEVLNLAHVATTQLQEHSSAATARLVNLSGRQRMLSQRLALFFLARQQGARMDLVQRETARSSGEFEQAMQTLNSAPEATAAIRDNLTLAQGQWLFLKNALGSQSQTAQAANDVFTASENLLAVMETVTGQFARALA
ncbi:type IV pili methyl-accepting chemotaxis transducer N-terminal domain-containing protein [Roseateles sp. DC23W]|uniref:Type IV pili methyl-accepting chemotaxis transducer N-terminal domain-containing protein n=1 Tax=Pelomonas dachongensis TaxID=3299029 RepID=A0ABW7EHL1_9BURK